MLSQWHALIAYREITYVGAWRAKREIVSFRVVRVCARCLCEVRSGWKYLSRHFPFSLFAYGGFPFSLCPPRSYPVSAGFIGTYRAVPSKYCSTVFHEIMFLSRVYYYRNQYTHHTTADHETPQCQSVWKIGFILHDIVRIECNMTDYCYHVA